jgi:TPR repeat protein
LARRSGNNSWAEELWRRASITGACCASVNLADLLAERGDVEEAEALIIQQGLQKHKGTPRILGWIADICGQSDAARRWWNKAAEEGDTRAMWDLGNQAVQHGDTKNATDWFTKAAELADSCAMHELGQMAQEDARPEEAEEWFERAIANGCNHALVSLALLVFDRGDGGAARARELCLTVDNDPRAMFVLGQLAADRDDNLEAEEWWRKASELDMGCSMDKLGHLAESQGNPQEAISWWEQAVNTGCRHALVSLGRSKFVRGDTAGAKELLRRAAQTGDQDAARYLKDFGLT